MSKMGRWLTVFLCGMIVMSAASWIQAAEGNPLRAHIDVGAQVTDNRDSAPDGQEKSNVDIFIGPRAELLLDWESALLNFYYAPRYRYRTDPSRIQNDNEWHHDLNLIGEISPTERLTLRAQERFNYTDDPAVDELGATLRRDSSYLMNRAYIDAGFGITRDLKLGLDAMHMIKRYDDNEVASRSDEDRASVGVSLTQALSDRLKIKGKVSYQDFALEDAIIDEAAGTTLPRGFTALLGAVGVDLAMTPTMQLSGMLGVQAADYDDSSISDETTPFASAGVAALLGPTVKARAQASYMLVNAYAYPFSSQKLTSILGSVAWDVSEVLELSAYLEYRIEDYDSDSVNPSIPDSAFPKDRSGSEESLIATLAATLNVTPTTAVQLAYQLEDVSSDVFVDFTRNAGTITLSQEF